MIWTLLTVFASIIGLGIFFYYFHWYMKLLNMSELAIVNNIKKKDEDRWIPYSEIKDEDESTELNAIMAETDQEDEEFFY